MDERVLASATLASSNNIIRSKKITNKINSTKRSTLIFI